ncbi:hypothetical protein BE21_02470 [Sorangium cellulosum]|uniref:EGF-like domain-containing protein n=1 Tax=Sorangium cellulosum TaxID=56 RepID=A0A150TSH1_SORCE|nr:hypothetical protein BE21_02470 [Sorangium cellulosum]
MWIVVLIASVLCLGCASGSDVEESDGQVSVDAAVTLPTGRLVDECATGNHDCALDALCIDTVEGFECKCLPDYYGDGRTCLPVSGVAAPDGQPEEHAQSCPGGCGENARCVEVDGGAKCACLNGFELMSETCKQSIAVTLDGGAAIVRTDGAQALVLPPRNLLKNPSFESGSTDGWTLHGRADGWKIVSPGVFGRYGLASGSARVAAEQVVDLTAAGYSTADLDSESPPRIYALVIYKMQAPNFADYGNIYIDLLGADMTPVLSWHDNLKHIYRDTNVSYAEYWHDAYPPGVRYVRLRVEAWDAEMAVGEHRGLILDGAAVTVGEPAQLRWTNDGVLWTDWFTYQPMIGSGIGFTFDGEPVRTLTVEAMTSDGAVYAGADTIGLE